MDKKTIFIRTDKGEREAVELSGDLKRVMSLIDNKSTVDELNRRAPPSLRDGLHDVLEELVAGEYIRDKDKPLVEPKIAAPKITPPKMFVPKPVPPPSEELDFTSITSAASASNAAELAAKKKTEDAARGRAELEAAVAEAKAKATAEAEAKAGAKARQEAEIAARARTEAEAKAKHEAAIREQAEAKAKQEAAARMQAEQVAARAKAELEAAAKAKAEAEARVRAEIEAAAHAKQEAEAKAKREAEAARLKAEQEAARVKAELEAAAKARAEAEAARIKAEQEAERVRQELAAAKVRAEAEAKALAEARARQEAEEKARREAEAARLKAEQEAASARLKAEQEAAAHAKAEAEARIQHEAEEKARHAAEAARLRAEQETARLKADQEAESRARAEASAKHEAEEKIRVAAAAKRETEEQSKRAERDARSIAEKEHVAPETTAAFEINLSSFLGEAAQISESAAPAVDSVSQERAEAEAKAKLEVAQRAAAEAKADAGKKSKENAAAEMARMKAEAEAARQRAEEEARRKAEEQALANEQENAWAEAEQRAQAQAKIEAEQAAQQAALSQAKSAQKPVSRTRHAPLPLGKIAFTLIALALVTLVVLPYVYPLQEYVAPLEQRLSAQLKQPVRIVGLSAASLPPRLQLQGVTVGSAQEVKIGSVVLNFDFLSLLSEIKVVSNAELQDVSIDGRVLDKQMLSLKSLGGDTHYPVRNMTLQRMKIVADEVALPTFSGIADIDAQGGFSRVSLHSSDDKYNIDLQSKQGRWQLGLSLKETSLPFLPGVVFSDLNAKGDLGDGEVNFTEMDGHLYNGILLGNAKLNWRKGWQLQGHLEAKTFELNKMFPSYGIEGELFGEGTFTLTGAKLSQLGDAPRLEASFSVKKGVVNGIDMVETARLGSRENLVGGRTHFDDMIGLAQLENHAIHFRQLKVVSGMLSANGSFNVSPDKQLSGDFNAEIKMRAGINQLTLFGSLGEKKLRAGR
jgi:hypothetical protein